MHVTCKKCGAGIRVAHRPTGSTQVHGIGTEGNVSVDGGVVRFGPGGRINFGQGGSIGFGPPAASQFTCLECGHLDTYLPQDFKD